MKTRAAQTVKKAIASVLRFGGLSKLGVTPSGGGIAGPFKMASCTDGGRVGNILIMSLMVTCTFSRESECTEGKE